MVSWKWSDEKAAGLERQIRSDRCSTRFRSRFKISRRARFLRFDGRLSVNRAVHANGRSAMKLINRHAAPRRYITSTIRRAFLVTGSFIKRRTVRRASCRSKGPRRDITLRQGLPYFNRDRRCNFPAGVSRDRNAGYFMSTRLDFFSVLVENYGDRDQRERRF